MTELILFLLLGLVFGVVLVIGGINHLQQQRKSRERQQYHQLKHQVDTIQDVLHQLRNIDPLPDLHLTMTDYLLTCLTNLRSLGVNIKSVDAEIADAKERRDLIQKGAVKFRANLPVGDLGQVNKIKKLYQRVAGLLKRATAHGLLKVDRYNHLLAHLNWQRLRVEADYYACKAKKALKSQDDSIARKNLYHARRLLANSKVNHPGRKEKFVSVNELLGAIQKQESESPEPPEEIPSSDHLENMTFMTDINQKKRSF